MKVLAAEGYILCRCLLRTLMLLYDDVCVTAANSIDEVLAVYLSCRLSISRCLMQACPEWKTLRD